MSWCRTSVRLGVTLSLLLVASLPARADERADRLKQAAASLGEARESSVHQGGRTCLELNDVPAMELLLDTLGGEQPHFRDQLQKIAECTGGRFVAEE